MAARRPTAHRRRQCRGRRRNQCPSDRRGSAALPAAAAAVPDADAAHLVVLSARDDNALAEARGRLAAHVEAHAEQSIGDIAFTLQTGRRGFVRRFAAVVKDRRGLIEKARRLRQSRDGGRVPAKACIACFQARARNILAWVRAFTSVIRLSRARSTNVLRFWNLLLGLDLRKVLFGEPLEVGPRLQATALAQPALFSVNFSVAALWRSLGFEPAAMLGHSVGEFVAATLAGVMRLEDALEVVAARGAMMQELPEGAMLAVMLAELAELKACLPRGRSLDRGGQRQCRLRCFRAASSNRRLRGEANRPRRRLAAVANFAAHAFHSAMVDPVIEPLARILARILSSPPAFLTSPPCRERG